MARPMARFCSNGHDKLVVGTYNDRRCKLCNHLWREQYRAANQPILNIKERERRRLTRIAMKEAVAKEQQPKVRVSWG